MEINPVTAASINSSGNDLPAVQIITPSQIAEEYEGELIKIENASFDNSGSAFSGNSNYNMTANGESFTIRINTSSPIVGQNVPAGLVDITSICSQYSYTDPNAGYQLLPRDMDDIQLLSPLYFTSVPVQSDITTQGFTITWETNELSSTEVFYGLTESLELGTQTGDNNVTLHSLTLSALEAGNVYYVKAFSVSGTDTTPSNSKPYVTKSNSSGIINIYFNHAVDNSVSTGTDAVAVPNAIADTVISYINKAQSTLDVCVYNNNSTEIVQAINSAYNRGVVVRYVTEDENANTALSGLNSNIHVLAGNATGLMHDKIIIIDAENADNAWIMSGSTNFTSTNLNHDYNNMVWIQDQSLAKAYRIEFEEMWGGSGDNFNAANSKFGSDKKDNTPHSFIINDTPVELYFSPSDNTTNHIVNTIATANSELEFAMLTVTKNEIGAALVEAHNDGANVKGIVENVNDQGSEFQFLLDNGIDVIHHSLPYDIHHKYAIIDAGDTNSDPMVLTGSHNWTASAENNNDENTLVIHNASIANQYFQEFSMRWQELIPTSAPTAVDDSISVVQNIEKVFDVTANDDYLGSMELIITTLTEPLHGTLTLNDDNTYSYTPVTAYIGSDSFTYKICYSAYPNLCSEASCNLIVDIEQAPIAVDDTVSVAVNVPITFNVLLNDLNPNNVDLIASVISGASNGNEIMIDSNITYVPAHNFEGRDTIVYQICSANTDTLCSEANFIISVGTVGLELINNNQFSIEVFPNPNNGSFYLSMYSSVNKEFAVSVFDIVGKQIYHSSESIPTGNSKIPISIQNIEKGIYFISVKSEKGSITQKVIIE